MRISFALAVYTANVAFSICQILKASDDYPIPAPYAAATAKNNADSTLPRATPEQLVRDALIAESAGDVQRRADSLAAALTMDPNFAPAHWQNGEVRVGDHWQTPRAAAQGATKDGKVAKYQKIRASANDDADSQMSLAKFCAKMGLKESERFHLLAALQASEDNTQARQIAHRLDLVFLNGKYVPRTNLAQVREETKDFREWRIRFAALRHNLRDPSESKRDAAFAELNAVRDPAAIPALEAAFMYDDSKTGNAVVEVLSTISGQRGCDAIARFAVFSPQADVRHAAALALKPHAIFAYAPKLVSGVESMVDAKITVNRYGEYTTHSLVMFREGPTANYSVSNFGGSDIDAEVQGVGGPAVLIATPDRSLQRDAEIAAREKSANENRKTKNERIAAALSTATGEDIDSDPQTMWKWWMRYNDIYEPEVKAVNSREYYHTPVVTARFVPGGSQNAGGLSGAPLSGAGSNAMPVGSNSGSVNGVHFSRVEGGIIHDCFPAGTLVETSVGPTPIEKIVPGDVVLAQNPESGELSYKPVLYAGIRPKGKLIEVRADGETIRATRGHPFWVDGIGWQMAKELKAGQWLHSATGPIQIETATEGDEEQCHVLVVDGFHSYFVGRQKLLVHDNNLREVTSATVPGLVNP